MMSQAHISDLPEEMMIRIFHLLPLKDLKTLRLVCKVWKNIGGSNLVDLVKSQGEQEGGRPKVEHPEISDD